MNDHKLFDFYLSLRGPEAGRWNGSPESLYLEYETRCYFRKHIDLQFGLQVLNVGIGTGEWDDFLGYELDGIGHLTSVDIDPDICDVFRYRQSREGHSNSSDVICCDFIENPFEDKSFDLITIIGSTMKEIGNVPRTIAESFRLLVPGGILMCMDFEKYHPQKRLYEWIEEYDVTIEDVERSNTESHLEFYIMKARKNGGMLAIKEENEVSAH